MATVALSIEALVKRSASSPRIFWRATAVTPSTPPRKEIEVPTVAGVTGGM